MSDVFSDVRIHLVWSLKEGDADEDGRELMFQALRMEMPDYLVKFKDGFMETQRAKSQKDAREAFNNAWSTSQFKTFNVGRDVLGFPPIQG